MGIFSSNPQQSSESPAKRNVDTVIGAGAIFDGELRTDNSVCIEGTVRGRLNCSGRVILNKSGVIEADVVAEYISVNGTVIGNVKAGTQLDVGESGVIEGDVEAASITVAKGGVLRGSCTMAAEPAQKGAKRETKPGAKPHAEDPTSQSRGNGSLPAAGDTAPAKTSERPALQ
jgi:cytoskeletal protein CcmA (bactofilin family)